MHFNVNFNCICGQTDKKCQELYRKINIKELLCKFYIYMKRITNKDIKMHCVVAITKIA